ncbi:MotE family protein [Neobacillus mesonae]|uniref:MotE family protein n=1 Tax=Neobacillus mesonae TaxID=1193713 RepID=UPI00203B0919|nr:hypothetical protein [Neobacillus mesonae]MCM3569587.1 hypothetical protein [Neobacillus mesonae]
MEEKEHGKLRSFIYFVFFPLLGMCLFGMFIFNWLGFPVWQSAKDFGNKLPVISAVLPDPAPVEAKDNNGSDYWKQQYSKSNAALKDANNKLDALNKEIDSNKQELDDLKKNNEELQSQLQANTDQKNQVQAKKIAAIYDNMTPSKAAAIMDAMTLEDAAITISMLDEDQQSSIMGSMKDTNRAAKITSLLKSMGTIQTTDMNVMKEELQKVLQTEQNPTETIAETIAQIPPAQSAELMKSMMKTNAQTALTLMKDMNTASRSQILTEIAKKDAGLAADITVSLEK